MSETTEAREMTPEECRKALLDHLSGIAEMFANDPNLTKEKAIDLTVFSFLVAIDGESELPSMNLIPVPHEDDKAYCQEMGENWWPEGLDLSDGELHSRWARKEW